MFYQANINNPVYISLSNQAHDIRNYLTEMELMGDIWDEEDFTFYLYVESLLMEIEEEIYHLVNYKEDIPQEGDIPYN